MTPRLPALKPREVIRALERAGFFVHHVRGSHHQLRHRHNTALRVTVPMHAKQLYRPLLRAIIRQAGMTVEEFWSSPDFVDTELGRCPYLELHDGSSDVLVDRDHRVQGADLQGPIVLATPRSSNLVDSPRANLAIHGLDRSCSNAAGLICPKYEWRRCGL